METNKVPKIVNKDFKDIAAALIFANCVDPKKKDITTMPAIFVGGKYFGGYTEFENMINGR